MHRQAPAVSWTLLLVAIGVLAWARVFTTWFAQDDFLWMLRAANHQPVALTTPRWLSMSLYFRALLGLFGTHAVAWHAFNLSVHIATGLLLHRLLATRLTAGVATAAAALFLTSPALFDSLHWVADIADLMCGWFLVLAVWLMAGRAAGRGRAWLGVAAYGLALASKETAVGAAPALVLLVVARGERKHWLPALGCVAMAALIAVQASGTWRTGGGGAYAHSPGAVLSNLPAFVAAAALCGTAWADASDLLWGRMAWVQIAGWLLFAGWVTALVVRGSKEAWFGCMWFLGLLAPVLLFERQFYFYYLYCALPGLVASIAFLVAEEPRGVARGPRPVPRWVTVAAGALIVAQAAAIEARSTSRLILAPLPSDFVLRRALIAHNAIADLTRQRERLGSRVVLLGQQPVEAASQGISTTAPTDYRRDPWWDENVRGALSEGDAVRLMFPSVRKAVFKPWLDPGDTSSTIVAYRIDGHLEVTDYASFVGGANLAEPATMAEHLGRAGSFIMRRLFTEALRELLAARTLAPDHPDVLINLGALQANMGDSTGALATLTHAVRVAPDDLEALYDLGLIQWRLGRRPDALATWDRLLAQAPGSDLARRVRELKAGQAR
jgi:tetratricopeptide (TPR) repeat protein